MNLRKEIHNVLLDIICGGGYSNIVLDQYLKETTLSRLDQKFLVRVVLGVLQNYYYLEYQIARFSTNNLPKIKMKVLLMLSLYQMRFMDKVPVYAIIDEAVEIAKEIDGSGGGKYANALLRAFSVAEGDINKEDFSTIEEYLHIKYSHPLFLIKIMMAKYGLEKTVELLKADHHPSPVTVRVNTLKAKREDILKNPDFIINDFGPLALDYQGSSPIGTIREFYDGLITIQDISSQMIAPLFLPLENVRVLDMCAAPGSKSTHIAQLMNNQGEIVAIDKSSIRLTLLLKAAKRMGVTNIKALAGDSIYLTEQFPAKHFQRILLDAPCSGLGVIRRKPDILIKSSPEKIDDLVQVQQALLEEAYKLLDVNGILIYSTCTIVKKENQLQISQFLERHKDMELITEQEILTIEYNGDSFYYAKMRKKDGE